MKFILKLIKEINSIDKTIFYSLINYKNDILGFCRKMTFKFGRNDDYIKKIKFNKNFDIIENIGAKFRGEDPRAFIHNNKLFVLDNFWNDMHLFDYDNKTFIKININGKNLSFISHNNCLYFIYYMKPFVLYELNVQTGDATKIDVETSDNEENYEYRGGTPGYKYKNNNEYYGFGHRTYHKGELLIHDIFLWIIKFTNEKPSLEITDIIQPINSLNICDPTSVIEIDNKKYLITAETMHPWFADFSEQKYVTNVYEIIECE